MRHFAQLGAGRPRLGHSSHWYAASRCVNLSAMETPAGQPVVQARNRRSTYERFFYKVFLPIGVVANLVLGVFVLSELMPVGWTGWLQVGTGAFCCVVAGWLAAAAWSKSYWNRTMTRQVTVWHQIADTFFDWLEDAPLPPEALHGLKTSLDKVVPASEQRLPS